MYVCMCIDSLVDKGTNLQRNHRRLKNPSYVGEKPKEVPILIFLWAKSIALCNNKNVIFTGCFIEIVQTGRARG